MTGSSDIESDYLHLDNLEEVTITANRKGGDLTDLSVKSIRMDLSTASRSFGGVQLQGDENSWVIPVPELSNVISILPGDTITDSGSVSWKITNSRLVRWNTQYMVIARKHR